MTPALMCFLSGAAYDETNKGRIFKGVLLAGAGLTLTIGERRSAGKYFIQIGAGVAGFLLGSLYKTITK